MSGKTVQIRRGTAAVTGDETRNTPLFLNVREGAGTRMIRKPESLSEPASHTLRDLRGEGKMIRSCSLLGRFLPPQQTRVFHRVYGTNTFN